jgi:putative membrane protein
MLKQIVFSGALMVGGAALAQTPPAPGGVAPPFTSQTGAQAPSGRPTAGAVPQPNTTGAEPALTAPSQVSAADKKFVTTLASGNQSEIEAAKMALDKASSQHVKDVAQTMITDHTDAGSKLAALAQRKGLTVSDALLPADQKEVDKFSKLSGKKFDRTYVRMEIKDHQKVLALLKSEVATGKDPDVKALAESLLPTIQKHLELFEDKGNS